MPEQDAVTGEPAREMIPKPKTADEMLKLMDQFMVEHEENETRALWNILSAVRGPDDNDEFAVLKDETTSKIRWAAFPEVGIQQIITYMSKTGATFRKGVVVLNQEMEQKLAQELTFSLAC